MGMTIEEIIYRLQALATMCTFQDAVGHDLSHKEIGLYNQAKDEAVEILKKYQDIQEIVEKWRADTWTDAISYDCMVEISEVME